LVFQNFSLHAPKKSRETLTRSPAEIDSDYREKPKLLVETWKDEIENLVLLMGIRN